MKEKTRCTWAGESDEAYIRYHDEEWGVPVHDDQKLFEFIVLESAQAGLSWRTILNRREGYRDLFKNFDPEKVAAMTDANLEKALLDPRIIRNRLKVFGTRTNARCFIEVEEEFGSFDAYLWKWVGGKPIQNDWKSHTQIPAVSDLAVRIAKDLKKRGFTFLGPTIIYAYMQAVGMTNDHTTDCFRHQQCKKLGKATARV